MARSVDTWAQLTRQCCRLVLPESDRQSRNGRPSLLGHHQQAAERHRMAFENVLLSTRRIHGNRTVLEISHSLQFLSQLKQGEFAGNFHMTAVGKNFLRRLRPKSSPMTRPPGGSLISPVSSSGTSG